MNLHLCSFVTSERPSRITGSSVISASHSFSICDCQHHTGEAYTANFRTGI
jgi:hypothetical protein